MLTVNRWNPFDDLTTLHRDLDRMFGRYLDEGGGRHAGAWRPAAEVTTAQQGWRIRVALPGVDPAAVTIDLQGAVLRISGERPAADDRSATTSSEFGYGAFERTFTLPPHIDGNNVRASFRHGMLEVDLPLAESARPRRIEIGEGLNDIDVKKIA